MSFSSDLVLDDADGTDITFRLIGTEANGSKRINVATDLRSPYLLRIAHSVSGKGAQAIDRHLVQFSNTQMSANGNPVVLTTNFTLAVPRDAAITNQMVYDQVANLLDLLSDGALTTALSDTDAVASLLRGEV